MADTPKLPIGTMVRYDRRKNGNRSQVAIAGLCGITERYLSLIETGKKTPSPDLLARLAAKLNVPVSALLSDEPPVKAGISLSTAPHIARALLGYGKAQGGPASTPADLRDRVEEAWRIWQTSEQRFSEVETVLPRLIGDVELAVRLHRAATNVGARREVLRSAADLYGVLRSHCRRTGRMDLALMVADRARRAAEDAGDPIHMAAANWNFGHCLLSQEDGAEEAGDIARVAVDQLQAVPHSNEKAALQGALQLVQVVADAQSKRWWPARQRLTEKVAPLAQRAGDANIQWTVFGPTNVQASRAEHRDAGRGERRRAAAR